MFTGFAGFGSFAGFSGFQVATGFADSLEVAGPEPTGSGATVPVLQLVRQLETIIPTECFARSRQEPLRRSF